MTTKTPTKEEAIALAKIIMIIEGAKQKDAQLYLKFEKNRRLAKDAWEKLPKEEKEQKTALGLNFREDSFQAQSKWVRAERRKIRYKLFRIREGKWKDDPELSALREWFSKQFDAAWTFNDFTFKWDVSCGDPLKVITPYEWDGKVIALAPGDGKFCDPAAFTKQEM